MNVLPAFVLNNKDPYKWLFKNKYNADEGFQCLKARFEVKGFNQTKCFNYTKTFNPVVKHNTLRVVLVHVHSLMAHSSNRCE